jgi:hypothetical protein
MDVLRECTFPWWDSPRCYDLTFVTFARHHLGGICLVMLVPSLSTFS